MKKHKYISVFAKQAGIAARLYASFQYNLLLIVIGEFELGFLFASHCHIFPFVAIKRYKAIVVRFQCDVRFPFAMNQGMKLVINGIK